MTIRTLGLVVLFSYFSAFAAESTSTVYDLTQIRRADPQTVSLTSHKTITFRTALTGSMKVLFEDLHPGANWSHPAKLRVVAKNGTVLEEVPVSFPPVSLNLAPVIQGQETRAQAIEFKLNDFKGQFKVEKPETYYAVLINGQADQRHWNDTAFLYRVLVQIYGYNPANIFVADGNFKDSDLDGDGNADVQYDTKRETIRKLMEMMKTKVTYNDHLVIAVNDHGDSENGESTIVLEDGSMPASEFQKLLVAVPAGSVLSIYEQCYSGGFVRPSVGHNRVSMAAATDQEFSWASMDLNFDEFIYHVISAFAMQTHSGRQVQSDVNGDGVITATEAFSYATALDGRQESPLLEADSGAFSGRELSLGKRATQK